MKKYLLFLFLVIAVSNIFAEDEGPPFEGPPENSEEIEKNINEQDVRGNLRSIGPITDERFMRKVKPPSVVPFSVLRKCNRECFKPNIGPQCKRLCGVCKVLRKCNRECFKPNIGPQCKRLCGVCKGNVLQVEEMYALLRSCRPRCPKCLPKFGGFNSG